MKITDTIDSGTIFDLRANLHDCVCVLSITS